MATTEILVTGAGAISSLGCDCAGHIEALAACRCGIAPVRYLHTAHGDLPVGEIDMSDERMAALASWDDSHPMLRTAMAGTIAVREAVTMAMLDAGLRRRCAFINGTTVGGMDNTERHFSDMLAADAGATRHFGYNSCGVCTDLIAGAVGLGGYRATSSTACSSAANAIIMAAMLIEAGLCDIAVAGGTEALSRFHLNGFNTLMILDSGRCRPFDNSRRGINLGEGAGYLVLESARSAAARGVVPLARLAGWGNACDAFHQTASSDNGEGACRAMSLALAKAGMRAADIGYVNTHGTGTPNNDVTELAAMHRIFGERLPLYASTKSLTGHTTSASGGLESVFCVLGIAKGFVPAGMAVADPMEADNAPMQTTLTDYDCGTMMCNAFGFGGNDSSLIFTRP